MKYPLLTIGGLFGALAVGMGAFGAHVLRSILSEYAFSLFQLAAQYMLLHAAVLVGIGVMSTMTYSPWLSRITWCFSLGLVLFCGSLCLIAFTGITAFGAIAPIGGVTLILGWVGLAFMGYKGLSPRR